jgi:hypothetical protein
MQEQNSKPDQRRESPDSSAAFNPLFLLPIVATITLVSTVIIYAMLPDKKLKICNLSLGYRAWWRWLCCGICCNLYFLPGITLEGKCSQHFEKHQQQLDQLKSELAEQREAREKSEKLFIQTCEHLKSEAESLRSTIERLQGRLEPGAGALQNALLRPPAPDDAVLVDIVEPFSGAPPPTQLSMELRHGIELMAVSSGGGRVYIPVAAEGQVSALAAAVAAGDPVKDAMAAARFRRMLGGRLARSGSWGRP